MDDGVTVKKWTSDEPPPEQMRWKVSYKDENVYTEVESNSLTAVIRILLLTLKQERKRKRA